MDLIPRVRQTGGYARACLESGRDGRVLASFSKAVYLTTDAGELFWLASPEVPMHRRCASLDRHPPKVAAGTQYRIQGNALVMAPGIQVELGSAAQWDPPLPRSLSSADAIASRIPDLFSSMDLHQAAGFGRFIPRILWAMKATATRPDVAFDDPILQRAQPLVLGMAGACLDRRSNEIAELADGLVGLGAGFTPSGDDYLGGLLFAVHALNAACPGLTKPDCGISLEQYAGRTHLISFTLLSDLAQGHGIAPMYSLIHGLIAGASPEFLRFHATQLLAVGHSTGWDLLTGLLTGLLAGLGSRQPCDLSQPEAEIQV